ncbi:MAG: hypothetical protein KF901_14440 [Myxococcales bacterium]|nr:hypothetical protein [Myxococcales bacterium]
MKTTKTLEAMMSDPDVRRARVSWTVGIIWVLLGGVVCVVVAAACAFTLLAGHLSHPTLHGLGLVGGFLLTPVVLLGSGVRVGIAMRAGRRVAGLIIALLVANIVVAAGSVALAYVGAAGL